MVKNRILSVPLIMFCVVTVNGSESNEQSRTQQIGRQAYMTRSTFLRKIVPKQTPDRALEKIIEFWAKQIVVSPTRNSFQWNTPLCAHFIAWKIACEDGKKHIETFSREPFLAGEDNYSFIRLGLAQL